jgi:hypothetical protein
MVKKKNQFSKIRITKFYTAVNFCYVAPVQTEIKFWHFSAAGQGEIDNLIFINMLHYSTRVRWLVFLIHRYRLSSKSCFDFNRNIWTSKRFKSITNNNNNNNRYGRCVWSNESTIFSCSVSKRIVSNFCCNT